MAFEDTGLGVVYDQGGAGGAGDTFDDFYQFVLNDLFRDVVADTVITPNTFLQRVQRTTERVEGKDVVFPIHRGRNHGVGGIAAGGLMPDPQQQQYAQYRIPIRHMYARMKVDGASVDASKSQMASWLNVLTSEAQGVATDLSRYRQRAYHNDGTGIIGQVDSVLNDPTQTVIAPTHLNNGSLAAWSPTRFLRQGQVVAFLDATGDFVDGGIHGSTSYRIVEVDTDADTIELSGTPAADGADHYIVHASTVSTSITIADTSAGNDPMGLAGIVDDDHPVNDTAFQGIDPMVAGNEFNRALVLEHPTTPGTARLLEFGLMDRAVTNLIETADVAPTGIYGSFGMVRTYYLLFPDERRYNNTMNFDGGYDGLTYDNIPLIADRDTYSNRFYFVYEPDLLIYVMAEPQWRTVGSQTYISAHDRDNFHATMYCRETLGSDVRDRHALLCDLTEETVS